MIGATTLAGGVNASNLNVTGFSIADDSLVTIVEFDEDARTEFGTTYGGNKEIKTEFHNQILQTDSAALTELNNVETYPYINFSVLSNDLSKAGVAQSGTAADSDSAALTGLRVRNSVSEPKSEVPSSSAQKSSGYRIKKVKIKDVKAGDYALSLDESTGKLVPKKVNALLDHGIKPIYEMTTEDGKAINTTAEHPYFVRNDQSITLIPSSARIQVLPLNLSENLSDHCRNKDSHLEISGGCTRITTIAGNFAGGNKDVFKKSLSNDNIALPSSHAKRYNLEFLMPLSAYLTSISLSESDLINLASTSSSAKNLNFKVDKPLTSEFFSSVVQGSLDVFFSQRGESFEDIFITLSSFKHLKDLRDPDSGAFEGGLSTTNFAVSNNEFIDFGSHDINNNNNVVFKSYDNELGRWIEVRYLKVGDEIAVPDYKTDTIKWERIASINILEPQHVYDLSIEGTRNFIANDIVAHNTYLATSSGNVGIGTTTPNDVLEVVGNVRISGSLNATNINASRFYARNGTVSAPAYTFIEDTDTGIMKTSEDNLTLVTGGASRLTIDDSGNVGIGTTTPDNLLTVLGNELTANAILHLNASDNFNTSVKNVLTLDHVLKSPVNSTGGIGVSVLFRATDNASQMSNIANISAVLYNATNGTQLSALTFSTRQADTGDGSFGHLQERMRIDGNGSIGIGTTSPVETLSVAGNFSTTKTNVSIGNGNFTIGQFNSSCTGFRFGATGGWILSCAP